MPTIDRSQFRINGVIDTNKPVWDNIEALASASGCWVTFDINEGQWSIIINRAGTSSYSFDNSNIIGNINISGTGIAELYNSVSVDFANKDIRDQRDVYVYTIPLGERTLGEFDNVLNVRYDLVNDNVQAQQLALLELNQSRVDKVIEFRTDYSKLGIKAGDLIDVTSDVYGFTNKVFRIITVQEEDADDSNIVLSITALEYAASVYDVSDVSAFERQIQTGIISKPINQEIKASEDDSFGDQALRMLAPVALSGLFNLLLGKDPITKKIQAILKPKDAARDQLISSIKPCITASGSTSVCAGANITITLTADATSKCIFNLDNVDSAYEITGVTAGDISPFPLKGTYKMVNGAKTFTIPVNANLASAKTLTFSSQGATREVIITPALAFTYVTTASPTSITEGASSTVALTTTGVANGTTVPYAITGAGTARVTTALTGNVTVNSNTASLTVNTVDDAVFTGTQSVTVTFDAAQADPCGQLDKTASITILDNDPAPPVDKTCLYVTVPLVWCAVYNGADNQLKNMTVKKSVQLPVAQAGEATTTVPLTVSVTKGNPSTIAVLTSATVASSAAVGGMPCQIITAFNSVAPLGLITGTTTTLYGHD